MPIPPEVLTKITEYEKQGYTPDEIMGGIRASNKYPDIVAKADSYAKSGYGADEILQGIKTSPVNNNQNTRRLREETGDVPEWGAKNPNLYGLYGAGRELLRSGIETAGTTAGEAAGALLPIPGTSYAGGGVGFAGSKRLAQRLLGEPVDYSPKSIAGDVAIGATQAGVGKLLKWLPGVNKVLAPEAANVGRASQEVIGKDAIDRTAHLFAEKSMKIPPSVKQPIRDKAINTMLDEGIPITRGGLKRTQDLVMDLTDKMDAVVQTSGAKNNPIPTADVLGPVQELRDWVGKTVNGEKLVGKIDGVVANFKKQYGDVVTVEQAQEIKQNTNALLKKMYGQLQPVTVEAQKQLVRGLKDRIAQEIPEIAGVNARYGDLKTLETALERAVNRTGNWDWLSLSSGVVGGVMGGTTGKVTAAAEAAAAWRILKSPVVQSHLAIMIKNLGKKEEANAMANAVANTIYHKMTDNTGGSK